MRSVWSLTRLSCRLQRGETSTAAGRFPVGTLRGLDRDHRFLDAARLARRTTTRLGEALRAELEAARLAAGRQDRDPVAARRRRSQEVLQVLFDIVPPEPELVRQRRHRSRLLGEQL